jgi:hypothetical protein
MTAILKMLGINVSNEKQAQRLIEQVMPSLSVASQAEVQRCLNNGSGLSAIAKTELGSALKGYCSA